jgi:LL-diaminopimelate aminotransferase
MAGRTGDADDEGRYGGLTYLPISAENDFAAQIPVRPGGSDLPLLPQQPHRSGGNKGPAEGLGGLRPQPTTH